MSLTNHVPGKTQDVFAPYELISHDAKDAKGRILGAIVYRALRTYVPITRPPGVIYGTVVPSDKVGTTKHLAIVVTARNGRCFGSSQSGAEFDTAEEADRYIARRLADVAKGNLKRAGK